jgi:hypothetical protein
MHIFENGRPLYVTITTLARLFSGLPSAGLRDSDRQVERCGNRF